MNVRSHAVVVFDLHNFSKHRRVLGKLGKAGLLTRLVGCLLDGCVDVADKWRRLLGDDDAMLPVLNHTGDGFVLILRDGYSPLTALLFASEFRNRANRAIMKYHGQVHKVLPETNIGPGLAFGIALNYGTVVEFRYKSFRDGERSSRGFLGTSINVASRIERKRLHPEVICTKALLMAARKMLRQGESTILNEKPDGSFVNLGRRTLRGVGKRALYACGEGLHSVFDVDAVRRKI